MKTESEAKLVTIYVTTRDKVHGHATYAEIIKVCQETGISGVTLVRCQEGYGQHGQLHTPRLLELSDDVPVRIEVIDEPAKVEALLLKLDGLLSEGLVTVQDVHVRRYRPGT